MFWQVKNKIQKQKFFSQNKIKNNFNRVLFKNYIFTKQNKFLIDASHIFSLYNNQVVKKNKYYRKYKNYCLITGKSRSVSRFCLLSRMQIKKMMNLGLLTGLRTFN
jgi:ribosomal protein S14